VGSANSYEVSRRGWGADPDGSGGSRQARGPAGRLATRAAGSKGIFEVIVKSGGGCVTESGYFWGLKAADVAPEALNTLPFGNLLLRAAGRLHKK